MSSIALSGIGILLSLVVMTIFAFRGVSTVICGCAAALITIVLSGLPVLETMSSNYIPGVASFFISYFLIFLLSSIMGKIYEQTGAARAVGEKLAKTFGSKMAMAAVVVSTAILIYGGITSFVVIFAIFPIALVLFEEADIPTRLIPGAATLGLWSFAMTGPFSTQIQNIIPMNYLGTSSTAALGPGGLTALLCFGIGVIYLMWKEKKAKKRGEHFVFPAHVEKLEDTKEKPNWLIALIPILFVIISFNAFQLNIVYALLITDIMAIILFFKYFPDRNFMKAINEGATGAVTVIINTAAIVGFGSVVKMTPFYTFAVDAIVNLQMNPYVLSFASTNIFAGLMGSSSGSLGLFYESLGDLMLEYGSAGYNLEFVHRLSSVGCAGLDSLPYCGAIISVLNVCGVTHKEGYFPIFINCTLIPILVGAFVLLPLCMLFG